VVVFQCCEITIVSIGLKEVAVDENVFFIGKDKRKKLPVTWQQAHRG
jgi:hypothetical protein